jgi:hypothetical protein
MANCPDLMGALERLDRGEADVLVAARCDRVARNTEDFATVRGNAPIWEKQNSMPPSTSWAARDGTRCAAMKRE